MCGQHINRGQSKLLTVNSTVKIDVLLQEQNIWPGNTVLALNECIFLDISGREKGKGRSNFLKPQILLISGNRNSFTPQKKQAWRVICFLFYAREGRSIMKSMPVYLFSNKWNLLVYIPPISSVAISNTRHIKMLGQREMPFNPSSTSFWARPTA